MTGSEIIRSFTQYPTEDNDEENARFLAREANIEVEKHDGSRGKLKEWSKGWRFTLFMASISGILVLGFNLGLLLWAVPRYNLSNGRGVLYDGDCEQVQRLTVGLHLVINILSTILLSASNFTMQCLNAPTRRDIDQAHKKLDWLDIGVLSVRNFHRIPRKRSLLWIILVLSSVPLHLMYNSTIFATISSNSYNVFVGDGSFGQNTLTDLTLTPTSTFKFYNKDMHATINSSFTRLHDMARNYELEKLDNDMCIDAYATTYQTAYVNLLLITNSSKSESEYFVIDHQEVYSPFINQDPYRWLCPRVAGEYKACSTYIPDARSQAAASNWTVQSYQVEYCLAEVAPAHCKLQYSLPLTVIVIIFITVKVAAICYVACTTKAAILTTGDAIASFIKSPDRVTQGKCLLSKNDIEESTGVSDPSWIHESHTSFRKKPKRWHAAVSVGRWSFGVISYFISVVICSTLLGHGLSAMQDRSGLWTAKLQALDSRTLITGQSWPKSMISNTLIANMPQLIYSIIYFAFNGILTTMTMAAEWSQYAIKRKGLRVSNPPRMSQRSTYFLSLPSRYAIPLTGTSAILHWLISQSLFLVEIEAYTADNQRDPSFDLNTCGYSPIAIVCSVTVGAAMVFCLIGLGYKRFKSGMPVAGSCSLAIAAACCPNPEPLDTGKSASPRQDMEYLPLQWGVVASNGDLADHCTFSSGEVRMPVDDRVYH
ncbi:hypothetical protein FQN49_000236 [Arthroderma sp. PD_2]|nr:hypothetical protein FQN49_000236 [Arthroderma sp. PD_2]